MQRLESEALYKNIISPRGPDAFLFVDTNRYVVYNVSIKRTRGWKHEIVRS